jgi:excisionase family DNA binding protein
MKTQLLTPRDVATLLQVTPRTVTRWCRDGNIAPVTKLGRVWRIEEGFTVNVEPTGRYGRV